MQALSFELPATKRTFVEYDFSHTNLFTMDNTVNQRLLKNPLFYQKGDHQNFFKIANPTSFSACLMNTKQYNLLSGELRKAGIRHSAEFYPAGYLKRQYEPLWSLHLSLSDYDYELTVCVVEFGNSYGTICVNGEYFSISHSGGSGHNEKGYTWTDHTDGWQVVDRPVDLIQLIINNRKK